MIEKIIHIIFFLLMFVSLAWAKHCKVHMNVNGEHLGFALFGFLASSWVAFKFFIIR